MSLLFDRYRAEIERGEQGLNQGLLTSLQLFNQIICGIQKKTYYLIGAEIKTGKTAFVDQLFVLDAYEFCRRTKKKMRLFYYSLEIDGISKIAKWNAVKMFRDRGIITSTSESFSKGGHKITHNLKQSLLGSEAYFEEMFDMIHIKDEGINPTGVWMDIKGYCEANGKFEERVKVIKGKEIKQRTYIPNDPDEHIIFIIDHVGLMKREHSKDGKLLTVKENIDKLSEYCVWLRNTYYVSPVVISQFNRELSDIDRQRFKELRPLISDFKNTGNPSEDANCIIALFNPAKYNISTYGDGKYNIAKLGGRFRSAHILENRDGDAGMLIGLNFLGECGLFRHFPMRQELLEVDYQNALSYKPFT
jgi:hypothetical protein